MEDTIEICSGCGKMPRMIDRMDGQFCCSRCGNCTTMYVTAENYEKTVIELDQRFHQNSQQKRIQDAASVPLDLPPTSKPKKKPTRLATRTKGKNTSNTKKKIKKTNRKKH